MKYLSTNTEREETEEERNTHHRHQVFSISLYDFLNETKTHSHWALLFGRIINPLTCGQVMFSTLNDLICTHQMYIYNCQFEVKTFSQASVILIKPVLLKTKMALHDWAQFYAGYSLGK